jgi:hypothetical protein
VDRPYSEEHRAWLESFARANAPHHFAASALVAVGGAADGFDPPRYEPALVAALVLGQMPPITAANVNALRALERDAVTDKTPVARDAATQAKEFLARMTATVNAATNHGPAALDGIAWEPSGVAALFGTNLIRYDVHQWLRYAVAAGLEAAWATSEIDVALRLGGGWQLYAHASAAAAERGLASEFAAERGAALARLQAFTTDSAAAAERLLRDWAATPRTWHDVPKRFTLGVFRHHAAWSDATKLASELVTWLRAAPAADRLAGAVGVLWRGCNVAIVEPLVDVADRGRFAERVLAEFVAAPNAHLALCVANLGTAHADRVLIDGLESDDERLATACEYALSQIDRTQPALRERAYGADTRLALRAARALAPSAQSELLIELADHLHAPVRWVALRGLRDNHEHPADASALCAHYAERSTAEQRLILEVVARGARTDGVAAWVLAQPALSGLEDGELERCTWLARLPRAWLDSLVDRPHAGALAPEAFSGRLSAVARAVIARMRERGIADPERVARIEDSIEDSIQPTLAGGAYGTGGPAQQLPSAARPLGAAAVFTVVTPASVPPNDAFIVEAFVHARGELNAIAVWSSIRGGRRFTAGPRRVPTDTEIEVEIAIPGIAIDEPCAVLGWDGEIGLVQFACISPLDAARETYAGTARFRVDSLELAKVYFVVRLGPLAMPPADVATERTPVRSAFASYATEDRERVLARIQGVQKVAPSIDVFLDVLSLRSGERWRDAIERQIRERDVLWLFWSRAASRSVHVETEWRTALSAHGLAGIDPVPLESPAEAPPPPELAALHFHDWTLTLVTAQPGYAGRDDQLRKSSMKKHVILFLAANPSSTSRLALDEECAAIERELRMTAHRDDFDFRSKWAVTVDEMMRHLVELKPAVIHFSGHGATGASSGIYLQGDQGGSQLVSGRALAMMIKSGAASARAVVLNACFSEPQADATRSVVDCVVGMAGAIGDDAARSFAVGFYGALGNRWSVGNAVEHAVATLAGKGMPDEVMPCCVTRDGVDAKQVFLDPCGLHGAAPGSA